MNKLEGYRKRIDLIDRKIVELLAMRSELIKKIGVYKKKNKIKIEDKKREVQVINNTKKYSNKMHQKFIINIFKNIIEYSKKLQK